MRALDRIDEALNIMKELEDEFTQEGLEVGAFTLEELGELYLVQGRTEEARQYLTRALPMLRQYSWVAEDRLKRIEKIIS